MAQTQTISTSLASDTLAMLEEVAENQNRSCANVIQEAVDDYLNHLAWFKAEVQKGIDDIEAGRVISHEEVKAKFRRLGVKC
jgi:predicted transcriptional regulator